MSRKTPIQQAISLAGSEAKLAALTGYSQVAINKAKHRGKPTPNMAVAIERGLKRAITREQLCPEFFTQSPAESAA